MSLGEYVALIVGAIIGLNALIVAVLYYAHSGRRSNDDLRRDRLGE